MNVYVYIGYRKTHACMHACMHALHTNIEHADTDILTYLHAYYILAYANIPTCAPV